jgi:ubiquinone biosynthesis protein UbiJ
MDPFQTLKELALRIERVVLGLTPPTWLMDEGQQKIVLFLNHVLKQESVAVERLKRQRGKTVEFRWNQLEMRLSFTPAGLVERVSTMHGLADLVLNINESSPLTILETLSQGDKPPIRIEGDVQLAAEVNWLIDHVRWDVESDLSRLFGDEIARFLVLTGKQCSNALKDFVNTVKMGLQSLRPNSSGNSGSFSTTANKF